MILPRRDVLKGMTLGAGSVLLSPILSKMQAFAAGQVVAPKRFVFVVESNGVPPQQMLLEGMQRKDFEGKPGRPFLDVSLADKALPMSLEPVARWKDRVTIVQGISGRVCGGGHSNNFMALGAFGGGRGNGNGESTKINGETVDGALARQIPGIFPHVGIGMSKRPENNVIYNISAEGPDRPLPTVVSPTFAYASLFGSVAEGQSKELFVANSNLLDFMRDDIRRVESRLAAPEREQLGSYLETYESLRNRQSRLNEVEHTLRKHAPVASDKYTSPVEIDRLDAMFDIGACALISGLTNVMTISSAAGIRDFDVTFTGLGIKKDKHQIGHGSSDGGRTYLELYNMMRRWHFDRIAELMAKLERVPEGDGTMLDNTLIIYLSDGADSHHSRCWEWPMVMLGNLGGRLRTGRYIDYPSYGTKGHRTISNMYTTLLQLAGADVEFFGQVDTNLAGIETHGRLEELLA
jgi:hypothetical protein